MKNIIKSMLVSMLFIGQLYAMDDQGGPSGIPTVQTQPMVKIKTNDDKIFEMPQSEAEKIPVIKGCLGSCEVTPSQAIPLRRVSSDVFQQLRDDFRRIVGSINFDVSEKDREAAAYELARNLPKAKYSEAVLNEKIALLKAADFLIWPELKQMYAKQVADMLLSDQFLSRLQQEDKRAIALIDSLSWAITIDIARYMSTYYTCDIKEIATIQHDGAVNSAVFSPDGSKVVTASDDRTAKIVDANTGAELQTIQHGRPVMSAVFSPDGSEVVTASDDGKAKIVDANTGTELQTIQHGRPVMSAVFSPDGSKVLTASLDKTAKIVDAATGSVLQAIEHEDQLLSAVFSPDGSKVLTVSEDRTAKIVDTDTGVVRATISHSGSVEFSPDGSKVVTTSDDGTAKIVDANTGAELQTIQHDGSLWWEVFSPDSSKVVTVSLSFERSVGTVKIVDAATGSVLGTISHNGFVYSPIFSPDGSKVVTASDDGTAKIIDADMGTVRATISHNSSVRLVVFSPDGSKLVTVSDDGKAKIVDADMGTVRATIQHDGAVNSVVFSPDGSKVVTASKDETAKIIDANTGAVLQTIQYDDSVWSAVFSPDSSKVVITDIDGTFRVIAFVSFIDLTQNSEASIKQVLVVEMLRNAQRNKANIQATRWIQTVVDTLSAEQRSCLKDLLSKYVIPKRGREQEVEHDQGGPSAKKIKQSEMDE